VSKAKQPERRIIFPGPDADAFAAASIALQKLRDYWNATYAKHRFSTNPWAGWATFKRVKP